MQNTTQTKTTMTSGLFSSLFKHFWIKLALAIVLFTLVARVGNAGELTADSYKESFNFTKYKENMQINISQSNIRFNNFLNRTTLGIIPLDDVKNWELDFEFDDEIGNHVAYLEGDVRTDQNYSLTGNKTSFAVLNDDNFAMNLSNTDRNGTFCAYWYDVGYTNGTQSAVLFNNLARTYGARVGYRDATSETNVCYLYSEGAWTDTGIARSVGWHEVCVNTTGINSKGYYDGVEIFSRSPFDLAMVGGENGGPAGGEVYIDNIFGMKGYNKTLNSTVSSVIITNSAFNNINASATYTLDANNHISVKVSNDAGATWQEIVLGGAKVPLATADNKFIFNVSFGADNANVWNTPRLDDITFSFGMTEPNPTWSTNITNSSATYPHKNDWVQFNTSWQSYTNNLSTWEFYDNMSGSFAMTDSGSDFQYAISDYGYQESANVSTDYGGLDTGSYFYSFQYADGTNKQNAIDGNWDTYSTSGVFSHYYTYYQTPSSYENPVWRVKYSIDSVETKDISIPAYCISTNITTYILTAAATNTVTLSCYNFLNSSFTNLYSDSGSTPPYIYEEGIWWEITQTNKVVVNKQVTTSKDIGWYVKAYDTAGNSNTTDIFSLYVIDAESPLLTSYTPNQSTFKIVTDAYLYAGCTDDNIYRLNISLSKGNTVLWSYQNTTPEGNNLFVSTLWNTAGQNATKYMFNVTCSDSHTAKEIKPLGVTTWFDEINFNTNRQNPLDAKKKLTIKFNDLNWVEQFEVGVNKQTDRYSFGLPKGMKVDKKPRTITLTYPSDIVYLPDSKYKAHFVLDNKYWLDFENGDEKDDVKVTKTKEGSYQIETNTDSYTFNSIGDLNINQTSLDIYLVNSTIGYARTANETTVQNFTINISKTYDSTPPNLVYNSINYGAVYGGDTLNGNYSKYWQTISIPLMPNNNTAFNFYWQFNYTYANGTSAGITTASPAQTVFWSHLISKVDITAQAGELDLVPINITNTYNNASYISAIKATMYNKGVESNITLTLNSSNPSQAYGEIQLPSLDIGESNRSINISAFMELTSGSNTYLRYFTNKSIDLTGIIITNCSDSSNVVLNVTLWNEEKPTTEKLLGEFKTTFKVWSNIPQNYKNFTYTFSNVTSFKICVDKSTSSYSTEAQIEYQDYLMEYSKRNYWLINYSLRGGQQKNESIYTIGLFNSTNIFYFIKDENDNSLLNAIVYADRYYPGENLYRAVEAERADIDGLTLFSLKPYDYQYRLRIYRNNQLIYTTVPSDIKATTNYININLLPSPYSTSDNIFQAADNAAVTFNNVTRTFQASLPAETSDFHEACFRVTRRTLEADYELYNYCQQTLPFATAYTINENITNSTMIGSLYFSSSKYPLNHILLTYKEVFIPTPIKQFGYTGLILAVLIIMVFAAMGIHNPSVMIFMTMLGILLSFITGMITFFQGMTIAIVIVALGGYYMVKMRT